MRHLKLFDDFVKEEVVKRVTLNKERAKSLVAESERKMRSLKVQLEKIGVNDDNANDYAEYCYNTLMYLIRAKLYLEGFSASGLGAHEAEVSYLRKLGFSEKEVLFANGIRYFRNGILYYGASLDTEYAEKVIEFTKRIYPKLKDIIKKRL